MLLARLKKFFISKPKLIQDFTILNLKESSIDTPVKLVELCESINTNYGYGHFMTVIILVRGILDYIPTIFGFSNRVNLISRVKNKKTFKEAVNTVENSVKNMADDSLHAPATRKETLKVSKVLVDSLSGNLEIILAEVATQIRTNDLREVGVALITEEKKDKAISPMNQLEIFQKYIEKEEWYKELIDNKEVWICKKDNLYQIHKLDDNEDFSEPWTQVYPDQRGSGKYSVDLKYNCNHIKRLTFVYCDGGRISVAMPKMVIDENKNIWENSDIFNGSYKNVTYFWMKDSLDYKLTELIGDFYIYRNIEGIARMSKIEIR